VALAPVAIGAGCMLLAPWGMNLNRQEPAASGEATAETA
jgi:hypothetical protein